MECHLAQINIAKILAPLDSPIMTGFVSNIDRINALAENTDGFVWRLKTDYGNNATSIKIYDDDFLIVNMSVWQNIESLFRFAYHSGHAEFYKRRKEWFEKMSNMHMALWYVPNGHFPSVEEATKRLDYLRSHGETPFAFGFRRRFSIQEAIRFAQ